MTVDKERAEMLVQRVLPLSPQERAEVLNRECGGQGELLECVERLLAAQDEKRVGSSQADVNDLPAETMDSSLGGHRNEHSDLPTADDRVGLAHVGSVISDRYKLVRKIGEGGMGEVWIAKQTSPVKRNVAIKLIKKGMDSKAVLARFEQERQALAIMDHPNIARVLDGGLTNSGQPFFVMELVNGDTLVDFCDKEKLTNDERLELFVPVCQAIQHAHQKGIVHRDLKPGNILVTLVDGRPVPKIIDFGVAKAMGGKLVDNTLSTQFGSVVGTLEYMSPEQASYSTIDVDTRADIYSLGVVLYELLTGLRPIDGARLKEKGLAEMIRVIQEEDPAKPSTRLSTSDSLANQAAARRVEPRKLTRMLSGELDWVVMKCLEKQRERRYETANALSRDIQRYLADETVEARPPSVGYRFQKFLRRNRGSALAVGLVFLALLAGVIGTTTGLIRARRAEKLAVKEAIDAELARESEARRAESERLAKIEAEKQKATAEARLGQIEKANVILGNIFNDLDINNVSNEGRSLELVLGERLKQAATELQGEAVGDTLVVANLQFILGRSLYNLAYYPEAIDQFKASYESRNQLLGADHEETLVSLDALALAYQYNDQIEQAIPLLELSLEKSKSALGEEHPETLVTMSNLGDAYRYAGQTEKAIQILEEALRLSKTINGPESENTANTMNQLAVSYIGAGRLDSGLPLLEQTLEIRTELYGEDHPSTLTSLNNLGAVFKMSGRSVEAEPLFERLVRIRKTKLGLAHQNTLISMVNLGNVYQDNQKIEQAIVIFDEAYRTALEQLGPENSSTLYAQQNLAGGYLAANEMESAIKHYRERAELVGKQKGTDSIDYAGALIQLGSCYLKEKSWTEAETSIRKCFEIRQALQPDTWGTANAQSMLGEALLGQASYEEAEQLLTDSYNQLKKVRSSIPPGAELRLVEAVQRLIQLYEVTENEVKLAFWLAERDAIERDEQE